MAARIPLLRQEPPAGFQIDSCAPQLAAAKGGKIKFHALSHGLYPGKRLRPAQISGISSLGFWDGVITQDWGLDLHRNEGVEICFLETGNMAFSVEAKNFELHPGQFTVTRPWQLHRLGAPNIGPGRLHWLIVDVGVRHPYQEWRWPRWMTLTPSDQAHLTRRLKHLENPVWSATPALGATFGRLRDCVLNWERPLSESRARCLLNDLFIEILTILFEKQTHDDGERASKRETVHAFLKDLAQLGGNTGEPWSLKSMATHCGMGITAFSNHCRKLVNCGPVEYLNECRLNRAARQLRENRSLAVIEVALGNGFNSSQYFATAFRRRFRVSPTQYRHDAHHKARVERYPGRGMDRDGVRPSVRSGHFVKT